MLIQTKNRKSAGSSHRLKILGWLIASSLTAPAAVAADNPGAHEHGRAQLKIAIENSQIDLIFTSPAYNLAGFEHKARTDEQKKQLANIRQWLETTPLINTGAGACSVAAATVQLGEEAESNYRHDHHKEDHYKDGHHDNKHHHDEKHHHSKAHHHEGKQGDRATHRDYDITQQLTCEGMTTNDAFLSPLPARFPKLRELSIEWVGPSGQGSTVISEPGQNFTLTR